ncbi:Immunoglobulin I-set [Trinorchestia longiramus]|nr:Immunoglobulin I-set [Trinorchestia longiramus]
MDDQRITRSRELNALGNTLPSSKGRNVQREGSQSGRSSLDESALLVDHGAVNSFEAAPVDGDTFDVWAHAMRLDDPGVLSSSDDSSSLPGRVQNNTEIVSQVGGTATLSCFTGHMSDETVTWLKREDDQLLTVGQLVYVSEERLRVSQCHRTKAWELFIKDVHKSDAGQYECQLTTHPPVSYFFSLRVTQAVAEVIGSKEVHIEEGSQLALECQVLRAPVPPIYIFWYHNGTMVNYNQNLIVRTENFTSSLVVSKVTGRDAGIYTCEPQLASPANVTVHVVTGERPAAMQHGHSSSAFINSPAHQALAVVLCFALGYVSLWHSSNEQKQPKLQPSSSNTSDGVCANLTCRRMLLSQRMAVDRSNLIEENVFFNESKCHNSWCRS